MNIREVIKFLNVKFRRTIFVMKSISDKRHPTTYRSLDQSLRLIKVIYYGGRLLSVEIENVFSNTFCDYATISNCGTGTEDRKC